MLRKPKTIGFRLNTQEATWLAEILASDNQECENASEWFRLLLHREHSKRNRLGVPGKTYQTAHRIGRPVQQSLPEVPADVSQPQPQ